jgi:DNA replicative helicase MCM subunit Mcm2 (Cdc46/Mcm family)
MFNLLVSVVVAGLLAHAARVHAQNVVTRESTVTATVDRIERSSRLVTFRGEGNTLQSVYVDPNVAAFNDLRVGDVVTVRYVESVIVQVRPDSRTGGVRDTTDEARKAGGDSVITQSKAVVTIEKVDVQAMLVSYSTKDGLRAARVVSDKRLLEGLRPGDRVEITLTRARAVDIQRKNR